MYFHSFAIRYELFSIQTCLYVYVLRNCLQKIAIFIKFWCSEEKSMAHTSAIAIRHLPLNRNNPLKCYELLLMGGELSWGSGKTIPAVCCERRRWLLYSWHWIENSFHFVLKKRQTITHLFFLNLRNIQVQVNSISRHWNVFALPYRFSLMLSLRKGWLSNDENTCRTKATWVVSPGRQRQLRRRRCSF